MDEGSSSSRNGILRKWVHSGGVSRVAYSPDGAVLYTTAGDFLRVWSGDPKDNAAEALGTIDYHQEATLTLDCSMESLVTGCEDGQVALFHHGTRDFAGLLTRSVMGMPIRSVRFSPNGQRVAVASDELIVKVVDVRDTSKMQVLEGHTKGVRGLTWSPDGQLITTSSSDGTIRVWDVSNPNEQEPTCIKVLDGLIAAEEPESEMQCEAVWHPSGRYFVVGTKSHEIAVVSKETWEREGAFEKDGHNGDISTLTFSPNGRYLCSASRDSSMIVWDCTARKPILRESLHGLVTSAAWRPGAGSNSITFIETSGYVSRWDDVISTPLAHPNDAPQSGAVRPTSAIEGGRGGPSEANPDRHREKSKKDKQRQNGGGPSLFDGDVEVEGDASADEKEDDDDDDLAGDLADLIDDGEVDDFIEDDDDENVYQSKQSSRKGESEFRMPPPLSTGRKDGREKSVTVATSYGTSSSLVRGQDPFQPGATPLKEKRRYLAFNMIGVLHIVERETHNIVTIDFHDQSSQASDHFDDYTKYDMGALGTGGAVYASSPASKLESSSVKYRPFQTWNSISAEWTIDLPVGETVTALAVGGGNNSASAEDDMLDGERLDEIAGSGTVVVATNRRFLRFLSGSGMQKYLMNFGEEIVTMTGGKEMLLIVHRAHEIVKPGYQELSYTLLDLDNYEILQRGPLPLLKGAKLAWAGFSEDQMPYIFDSTGLLSALERSRRPFQGRWVPVLDTMTMARREGKQESYWPVGVSEANFMCIILKGEEKFPYFPTPITTDLPVSLPLLEPSGAKTEIESKLLQTQLFCSHARDCLPGTSGSSVSLSSEAMELKARVSAYDLEMDKSVLKLVQLACKSERQQQALDLARSLSTSAGLSGAIKIASLYSLAGLVQKFENLRDVKEGLYGSSAWRDREAQKKREGKYAHLADFATVPDSALQIPAGGLTNGHPHGQGHANGASGANLLSMPFDNSSVRAKPKKTARNVFSAIPEKPRAPLPTPTQDSEMQDDESSYRYDEADGDVMDESQDSMRAGSTFNDDADGSVSVSAGPISKPRLNPFAKSAQPIKASSSAGPSNPVSSGPMNPFAKKAAPGGHGLKKTGSFFDRVDASNGTGNAVAGSSGSGSSTGSGSGSGSGSKQSTLFGLPAGSSNGKVIPEKKSARGKKRKSGAGAVPNDAEGDGADDGDDGVEVSSSVTRKIPKKLDSFFSKGPVASSSSNSNSNGLKRTPSKLSSAVVSADSAEEDVEETQMATAADSDRETEEPDPARLSPTAEEDEEEPLEPVSPKKKKAAAMLPSRNDGLSKLEQFKFKAPAAVVSAQEAEEDVLAAGAAAGIDGDGEEDM